MHGKRYVTRCIIFIVLRCINLQWVNSTFFRWTNVNNFSVKVLCYDEVFIFWVQNKYFTVISGKICQNRFCTERFTATRFTHDNHVWINSFSISLEEINKHRFWVHAKVETFWILNCVRYKREYSSNWWWVYTSFKLSKSHTSWNIAVCKRFFLLCK